MAPEDIKKHLAVINTLIANPNFETVFLDTFEDGHEYSYFVEYDCMEGCIKARVEIRNGKSSETIMTMDITPPSSIKRRFEKLLFPE